MSTPAEILVDEAAKAASVSNDGVAVARRSLSELIEYEKHLASKTATTDPAAGLRAMITRIVPPGGH